MITMIKRKSVIAAVLILSVLSCPVYAAENQTKISTQATETVQQSQFSIDNAVSYMLENSLTIKAAQENITSCELKEKADAAMKKRVNSSYGEYAAPGVNDIDTFLLTSGYAEYADAAQTTIAKRSLTETEYQLTMQLENKFYSCLNADKKIDVAKEALDTAKENERIAKLKKEAGTIGAIEADSFSIAVISSQNDYDDAVRDRDYMYEELKQLMGYPAESNITLTGSFERQPMNTTSLETALAGMDKTANKLNLDASLDLQDKLLAKYKSLYTTSMYEYQSQKYAYAKAESEYKDNVSSLRLGIINAYNTMVSTYGKLDYIDKAIELKEQQAEAKKTTYELGLATATDYITAVQELDSLKLQRVDAEIGAYLTSRAYEMVYHAASDAK
jgi:pentatricopeptide repeat protein